MISNEHLKLLLNLLPGDGGVLDDEVYVLLLELNLGRLCPPVDPCLGQNIQRLGMFPFN